MREREGKNHQFFFFILEMIRGWLAQGQSLLQSATELIAPTWKPRKVQIQDNWKTIRDVCSQEADTKHVKDTSVPGCLEAIISILVDEDSEGGDFPCLEYVLQEKIFEALVKYGNADKPRGMRTHIFSVLDDVIVRVKQPLIPQISIHRSITELMKVCGESQTKDIDEINASVNFISTICTKLHEKPALVRVFCEEQITGETRYIKLLPLSILQKYIRESDSLGSNARCGTVCLLQLLDDDIVDDVISNSGFIQILMDILQNAYTQLPTDKIIGQSNPIFDYYQELLIFCNTLAQTGHPKLVDALANSLMVHLFKGIIRPALLQTSDRAVCIAIQYSIVIVESLTHDKLAQKYLPFFCDQTYEENIKFNVATIMIERIGSLEENIRTKAMLFFEVILEHHQNRAIYYLISQHIPESSYAHMNIQKKALESEAGKEIQKGLENDDPGQLMLHFSNGISRYQNMMKWLSPDPRSIEFYHNFTQRSVVQSLQCTDWKNGYKRKISSTEKLESMFLKVLFMRLEKMLQQPLSVNILLTKLLMGIVTGGDLFVIDYLLNPNNPVSSAAPKSLLKSLEKVSREGIATSAKIDGFSRMLASYHTRLQTKPSDSKRHPLDARILEDDHSDNDSFFKGAVVFEEICKELMGLFGHFFFYLDGFSTTEPTGV